MTSTVDAEQSGSVFRLAYVPGATPAKWARIWSKRRPKVRLELVATPVAETLTAIRDGAADMAITRLPDAFAQADPGALHTIILYEETTVVVVPKDHLLTAGDELTLADLTDEVFLWPIDEPLAAVQGLGTPVGHRPQTTAQAVELVAAGTGLLLAPQSLARLHHRRDLDYRPVVDAPTSTVGLLWHGPTSEFADEFIGIVRGRKPNSSRGNAEPAPKRSAKEKAAAKRASREAAGKTPGKGKNNGKRSPRARRSR